MPRVFTIVFAGGCLLAGLAGVIGGNYQVTEPAMAATLGPIVFVVVVFGGLGSLGGCFIASIVIGHGADVRRRHRWFPGGPFWPSPSRGSATDNLAGEILSIPVSRVGPLLPYALMVLMLVFSPRA